MLEVRSSAGLTLPTPGRLVGYASIFDATADLGDFTETVKPGAFARSLASGSNVRALYDHKRDAVLGTTRAGTLKLSEDHRGLRFELALPDTSVGRDLAVLVERGDVAGASFGFRVAAGGDRWEHRTGKPHRELLAVTLAEITLTADPAYADTEVAKRSMPTAYSALELHRLWFETL
jgi:uncharacterized protein